MSELDFSNPQVLKNFLLCQMREGKGEFIFKQKVLIFRDKNGSEFVAPEEVLKEVEVFDKESGEKLIETPEEENVEESTGEVTEEGIEQPKKKRGRNKKE